MLPNQYPPFRQVQQRAIPEQVSRNRAWIETDSEPDSEDDQTSFGRHDDITRPKEAMRGAHDASTAQANFINSAFAPPYPAQGRPSFS